MLSYFFKCISAFSLLVALSGCGGEGDSSSSSAPVAYFVTGTTDGAIVTASGSTVSNTVTPSNGGANYSVSAKFGDVVTLTAAKTGYSGCVIAASPITVSGNATANVSGCTLNTYTIAVTNSSAAAVTIIGSTATNATNPNSATSFSFLAKHGDAVVLSATKTGNVCSVTPASINLVTGNSSAKVDCSTNAYTVSGTVSGLGSGKSVALQNYGINNRTVDSPGSSFSFPAQADGSGYNVTVLTQPVGQTCLVTNGTGKISGADVTNVTVSCTNTTYQISVANSSAAGVTITGSTATNATNPNSATGFSFAANYGDNVSLSATKTDYACFVAPASIKPLTGNSIVTVTCEPLKIGVGVEGLKSNNSLRLLKTITNDYSPDVAAVSFDISPAPSEVIFPDPGNYGWSFRLETSKRVSALGLWNDTFNIPITEVGLWGESSANPLVTGVFSTNSCVGLDCTDLERSGFLWLNIEDISLGPGLYTVGAFTNSEHNAAITVNINPINGLTIAQSSLFNSSSVLELPTDVGPQDSKGYFGPNLRFSANSELLDIGSNGAFYFSNSVKSGDAYTITVDAQPVGQTCRVINGTGNISSTNVDDVRVVCSINDNGCSSELAAPPVSDPFWAMLSDPTSSDADTTPEINLERLNLFEICKTGLLQYNGL